MPDFVFGTAYQLLVFVLTFVVGYSSLTIGYARAGRLAQWYGLPSFDKTIRAFTVGGIISALTVAILANQYELIDVGLFVSQNMVRIFLIDALLALVVGESILPSYLKRGR